MRNSKLISLRLKGQVREIINRDSPVSSTGRPRDPDALPYMRVVIRDRQNSLADYFDLEEVNYEWGELMNRWMPGNGVYRPDVQYVKD